MPAKSIPDYIAKSPPQGRAHLQRLYEILKAVAPDAQEAIKWGSPFFVEPRFLFSFSANREHLNFAPSIGVLEHFRDQLAAQRTTKHFLQVRYDEKLPEALIRKLARHQLKSVRARQGDSFW